MATYIEMTGLIQDSTLRQKVAIACIVAAEAIRTEDPATANHANRLIWAKLVYQSPTDMANKLMPSIIVQNSASTAAVIQTAADTAIQTAVNAAYPAFI